MERYAALLGADCAFFITSEADYAQGIGEILEPADGKYGNLIGYYLALVKPPIAVSTRDAFSQIVPKKPAKCCRDIVRQPIETWRDELFNDFEEPIFRLYPRIGEIKAALYRQGALFAQMSGSGSTVYGIFKECPTLPKELCENCFTAVVPL